MFDTHIHTEYSTDSNMTIEEVKNQIEKYNIGAIITEHMDLNYKNKNQFRFDVEDYFQKYSHYRGEKILLGMELGMSDRYLSQYKNIVNNYPFDYVIGSLHEMYDVDLYEADELYKNKSKEEIFREYFKEITKKIESHAFFIDSLGHIDYLSRCAQYEDKEMYYEEYKNLIDELFKSMIDKEICLELNTRRLGDKGAIDNLLKIYKRFNELGGKFITIGSDAHNKESIGNYFKIAMDMAEFCNLRAVYFKNRKIEIL